MKPEVTRLVIYLPPGRKRLYKQASKAQGFTTLSKFVRAAIDAQVNSNVKMEAKP